MLWTSLCSRLHLPISERALQLSHALISRHDHRATPAQSIYTPFPLGSQSWCMNVCKKCLKVVCLSTLLHDARSMRGCHLSCSPGLSHFSSLAPNRSDCQEHRGRRPIPSYPVSFSKAWLLTWRHRAVHSLFVASSKKKMSSGGGCRMRGQLQLRGQLSGPEREQQLLLRESITLGSEMV